MEKNLLYFKKCIVLFSILLSLFSCEAKKTNSENMELNGVLDYNWDTTIDDIKELFTDNNYSNIHIDIDDSTISANFVYNDFISKIVLWYFDNKISSGTISIKNIDELKREELNNIEEKLFSILKSNYGEPQLFKDIDKDFRVYEWKFINNCTVELYFNCLNYFSVESKDFVWNIIFIAYNNWDIMNTYNDQQN